MTDNGAPINAGHEDDRIDAPPITSPPSDPTNDNSVQIITLVFMMLGVISQVVGPNPTRAFWISGLLFVLYAGVIYLVFRDHFPKWTLLLVAVPILILFLAKKGEGTDSEPNPPTTTHPSTTSSVSLPTSVTTISPTTAKRVGYPLRDLVTGTRSPQPNETVGGVVKSTAIVVDVMGANCGESHETRLKVQMPSERGKLDGQIALSDSTSNSAHVDVSISDTSKGVVWRTTLGDDDRSAAIPGVAVVADGLTINLSALSQKDGTCAAPEAQVQIFDATVVAN